MTEFIVSICVIAMCLSLMALIDTLVGNSLKILKPRYRGRHNIRKRSFKMFEEPELRQCAEYGKDIDPDDTYYIVGDNYLQRNYFDDPDGKDNIFCSKDCLLRSVSVLEFNGDGDDYGFEV